jgi:glycine C-acetyltransferase/8-amino-7-oxononanoate synthase
MTTRRAFLRYSTFGLLIAPYTLRTFAEELGLEPDQLPAGQAVPFVMDSAPGAETVINGRKYIYFGGTGYFALHGNPEMIRAGIEAFGKYGIHSATTRSGFGNNPVLLDAEKKIAGYFGTEEALYYVSGYFNGLMMAQGLADQFDLAFVDETAHFSVKDGIYSTRKPVVFYKHRDPSDLRSKLMSELKAGQRPLVITDGVFPTFGVVAPVPEIVKELEPYNGILCLDDAHAVGVLGANGGGTCEHFGLKPGDKLIMSGTLSKAFGGHGGFIPASAAFIQKIKQTVGAYSGASPTPTPIAAASAKGIELVQSHPEWREKLRRNVARTKNGMRKLGFDVGDSPMPIVTWTLASADEMKKVQKELLDRGIAVAYLKYVGAPSGGVLRASIFSTHTDAQIDRLLEELKKLV